MKRNFTGPVWVLVIFGVLQAAVSYSVVVSVFRTAGDVTQGGIALFALRMMMWPMVMIGEAVLYWLIRTRNRAQLLSWTHVVIFCVAFVLNGLVAAMTIMHEPIGAGLRTRQGRVVEAVIFWALLVVSHVAFIQVLMLAFRKEPPSKTSRGESENLLDDVVL
jgi:hypothetical protein